MSQPACWWQRTWAVGRPSYQDKFWRTKCSSRSVTWFPLVKPSLSSRKVVFFLVSPKIGIIMKSLLIRNRRESSLSRHEIQVNKGPDALGKVLFILRKNLSSVPWDKCARWFLDPPNFVEAYQTSKKPSSCLRAGQIFVRHEIWQICQFTRHDLKEHVNQENFISIFSQSISIRSAPKLFLWCAAIKRWRWQIRTSICYIMILTQNKTITVPKSTFQLHLQGQVLFNLYRLK